MGDAFLWTQTWAVSWYIMYNHFYVQSKKFLGIVPVAYCVLRKGAFFTEYAARSTSRWVKAKPTVPIFLRDCT